MKTIATDTNFSQEGYPGMYAIKEYHPEISADFVLLPVRIGVEIQTCVRFANKNDYKSAFGIHVLASTCEPIMRFRAGPSVVRERLEQMFGSLKDA